MLLNFWIAVYVLLTIYAIIDVLGSRRDWATKVVLVFITMIPFVGAGLYLLVFRDKRPM